MRFVRPWHKLARGAVDTSLEVSVASLDGALNNLVSWKVSLPMTKGLEGEVCWQLAVKIIRIFFLLLSFFHSIVFMQPYCCND